MNKQIEKLNQRLAQELGYVGSEPRFQWRYSTELFYLLKDGEKTLEPTGDRMLALVIPTYQRHCWADRIGKCWALAQWQVPEMPQQVWEQQAFGGLFPYPASGQYYYVDGTNLRDGMPPDEDCTNLVIFAIKSQLELNIAQHIYETERADSLEREQRIEAMTDEVMEELPAFVGPVVQGHSE